MTDDPAAGLGGDWVGERAGITLAAAVLAEAGDIKTGEVRDRDDVGPAAAKGAEGCYEHRHDPRIAQGDVLRNRDLSVAVGVDPVDRVLADRGAAVADSLGAAEHAVLDLTNR